MNAATWNHDRYPLGSRWIFVWCPSVAKQLDLRYYIFSMVQSFGALALAAAMNARQVSTIFISYWSTGRKWGSEGVIHVELWWNQWWVERRSYQNVCKLTSSSVGILILMQHVTTLLHQDYFFWFTCPLELKLSPLCRTQTQPLTEIQTVGLWVLCISLVLKASCTSEHVTLR